MKFLEDLCGLLPTLDDKAVPLWAMLYEQYQPHFNVISKLLYERLPGQDRQRFITWFLKRWGNIEAASSVERDLYENKLAQLRGEQRENVQIAGKVYKLRDFESQGYPFRLLGYDWFLGVHDIFYNQYEHGHFKLRPGDVIIDAGAFIGDTAVFFHHKLQGNCEIHCFELLDENLTLLQYNLAINDMDHGNVILNKFALSDTTGQTIAIKAGRTQGGTSMFGELQGGNAVETITLDDYVRIMNVARVDFIKMDIEGAEIPALHGARETIRYFKPRLALCLYHKWDDVITIPRFLEETGVSYSFRFKWVQLTDGWEAVLLASPSDETEQEGVKNSYAARQTSPVFSALSHMNASYLKKLREVERSE